MASKSFIVLGLLLAALLVVSAGEMTEQPKEEPTNTTPVEESQEVGTDLFGGGYGGGHGSPCHRRCCVRRCHCCTKAEYEAQTQN
ncbi:hypothetical protein QJS10_CPB15g00298 [Acorus calamus]|uniref:Uncharacterized protein n=1 Tax=Acorus calamus TaxID=4465 RepID=A0AAV9D6B0_ACOCL|nr:hypothetical protein QJS10_CPB15g00298 [Acorus calamus]